MLNHIRDEEEHRLLGIAESCRCDENAALNFAVFAGLFSPITCGLMTRLSMLGKSAITQAAPSVLSHFPRHNSNGTRTWSMMGTEAMRSFVFGVVTSQRTLLRLM
jgi:hypothetical protein